MPQSKKEKVVEINNLSIKYRIGKKYFPAVKNVSLALFPGEVLALVGESGSGKSTTALAIPGLLAKNAVLEGSIKLGKQELVGLSEKDLNKFRGEQIAVIFQEPMTALNPVYTIGWQIIEAIQAHNKVPKAVAKERAIELLKLVEMAEPEKKINAYPHQLSGGQRQRAMIAQALASNAKLLIADEPTTALDVTVQAEILNLLRNLQKKLDLSIIIITHDLGVVADIADYVMVLKSGELVESGKVNDIFYQPQQEYTKKLLAAVPKLSEGVIGNTSRKIEQDAVVPALEFKHTSVVYNPGKRNEFQAVSGVSFKVLPGEVVGLVGESGSGKSTLSKTVVGLVDLSAGELLVKGQNIANYSAKQWAPIRKNIGVVFQDPGSSLNPRWPIGQAIAEPLTVGETNISRADINKRVTALLDAVELPSQMVNRYPHELSGGQRQRVGIARALSANPALLIADEPTSALDVSVQAKVLEIFQKLQKEFGFACLFITHDLAVIEQIADNVAVLNRGKLAEFGSAKQVLNNPVNDYTKRLVNAIPIPDPIEQEKRRINRQ